MLQVIIWSFVGSVVSLVGGIALIHLARLRTTVVRYALPFGAGTMLAVATVGILPEALEGATPLAVALSMLGGFLLFFILERCLGWFHHHEIHHHDKVVGKRNRTHQWLVIIGDTLHNAIDGVAIGAAFMVSPALGVSTSLAIAAHEVPQEIGDFGILLGKGMRPRNVIIVNLVSALATVVMAALTFALGAALHFNPAPLLAVAAGMFIYVAASDIIPDIHEQPRREANVQALTLLAGVAVMLGCMTVLPQHAHGDDDHRGHDAKHA